MEQIKRIASFPVQVRRKHKDKPKLVSIFGVASVFNVPSNNMGFIETVASGAFDNTDFSDVVALFNHDSNIILGSTRSNTLTMEVTARGLEYSVDPPDTALVRDMVIAPMERGDIMQSSFAFFIAEGGDEWDFSEDTPMRTITDISKVVDVSPVTYPAFTETISGIEARSKEELETALYSLKQIAFYNQRRNYITIQKHKIHASIEQ